MAMWEIKNSADPENQDTLDINIYSDVSWYGDYDDDEYGTMSAAKFKKSLDANPGVKNINVYINSCGGSVSEGVAIYSQLKRHSAFVTAYIDGFACSIASVIPMAADKIVMSDTSMMMIHNPWTVTWGNAKQLRKDADDLDKITKGSILPAYIGKVGDKISEEKLIELLDGETYLSSQECLEYGLCDEILESNTGKSKAKEQFEDYLNKSKSAMMNKFKKICAKAFNNPEPPKEEPQNDDNNPNDVEGIPDEPKNEPQALGASKPKISDEAKNIILSYFKKGV